MNSYTLLKKWQIAFNERVSMKPEKKHLTWFVNLTKDMSKILQIDNDEAECLIRFEKMCTESLSPEVFEQFENVKKALIRTRSKLSEQDANEN